MYSAAVCADAHGMQLGYVGLISDRLIENHHLCKRV